MRLENIRNSLLAVEEKDYKSELAFIESYELGGDYEWHFNQLLTPKVLKGLSVETLDEAKKIAVKKATKNYTKAIEKIHAKLDLLESLKDWDISKIEISVEWSKSWNPTATISIWSNNPITEDYQYNSFIGKAYGCGYDKESTAIAEALNQSNVLKSIMAYKANELILDHADSSTVCATDKKCHILGYGTGYSSLPYFEGGVGVSCYYGIFEKLGFKMTQSGSGKYFTCYTVESLKGA